jgi:integrase
VILKKSSGYQARDGSGGHSPGRAAGPPADSDAQDESRVRSDGARWRKAWKRAMETVDHARANRREPKPRHGPGYRGRLGQLLRELRALTYRYGSVAISCERAISAKTRQDRRSVMKHMLVDMYRRGLQLCHVDNFKAKHAIDILEHWTAQGLASSTMATYVSHLRTFVVWIGKRELLTVIDRYCSEHPGLTRRQAATDRDRSERGVGVEFVEIYRRATELGNEHYACQLLLIAAFGLRVREAWLLRPHLATDSAGRVSVGWGTKGGRPRELPVPPTETQRLALDRARALVSDRCGSMVPPGYARLEDWSREFYRLSREIGLTKDQLGATAHSLRHGFLLDFYRELAGVQPPVRSSADPPSSPAHDRAVRKVIAESAGHSRPQVSSAYLGSRRRRKPAAQTTSPTGDLVDSSAVHDDDENDNAATDKRDGSV